MEIEKQHTIEDFDKKNNDIEIFFDKNKHRKKEKEDTPDMLLFNSAILSAFFLLFMIYLIIPLSRIKAISVTGNDYLTKDYIVEKSGLSLDSLYMFSFDFLIERKLEKDPLIADVKVSHENNNMILIEIDEKQPYGYRIGDKTNILCTNGDVIELTSEYMDIIPRIPLIIGFEDEQQTHLLSNAFSTLDKNVIESLSEVEMYSMSYNDETLLVHLIDGNYFVTSYYGLAILNKYDKIASNLNENNICLYGDENNEVAYEMECPWLMEKVEYEYWTDDLGNYLLDKYGAKIIKEYQKDEDGNYILDEEGNRIPVPIDGEETTDEQSENEESAEGEAADDSAESNEANEQTGESVEEQGTIVE